MRYSDSVRIFRIRADVVDVRCDRTARGAGGVLNSQIGEDEHRTVHVRRRGLSALELAIDVEADLVGLPVDTISVISGWIGCLTIDLTVGLPRNAVLWVRCMNCTVYTFIVVAIVLNNIELLVAGVGVGS